MKVDENYEARKEVTSGDRKKEVRQRNEMSETREGRINGTVEKEKCEREACLSLSVF